MRMLHQIAVRLGVLVAADLGSPVGLPWPGALAGAWVRRSGRWGPGQRRAASRGARGAMVGFSGALFCLEWLCVRRVVVRLHGELAARAGG